MSRRLRAAEPVGADAELFEYFRQLVGRMLAVAHQLFQIVRRDPEIARDPIELGAIELPHLVHLAAMLQPACKGLDEVLDDGYGLLAVLMESSIRTAELERD